MKFSNLALVVAALTSITVSSLASINDSEKLVKFTYVDKDITEVIADYSKLSGEKFVYGRGVAGRVTILSNGEMTLKDAYSALSEALKTTGFSVLRGDGYLQIKSAQELTKDGVEVTTKVPEVQPVRVVTYIRTIKNADCEDVMKLIRPMVSNFGDVTSVAGKNAIMLTDWTSNIARLSKVIDELEIGGVRTKHQPAKK